MVVFGLEVLLWAFADDTFDDVDEILLKMLGLEEPSFDSKLHDFLKVIETKVGQNGKTFDVGLEVRSDDGFE